MKRRRNEKKFSKMINLVRSSLNLIQYSFQRGRKKEGETKVNDAWRKRSNLEYRHRLVLTTIKTASRAAQGITITTTVTVPITRPVNEILEVGNNNARRFSNASSRWPKTRRLRRD